MDPLDRRYRTEAVDAAASGQPEQLSLFPERALLGGTNVPGERLASGARVRPGTTRPFHPDVPAPETAIPGGEPMHGNVLRIELALAPGADSWFGAGLPHEAALLAERYGDVRIRHVKTLTGRKSMVPYLRRYFLVNAKSPRKVRRSGSVSAFRPTVAERDVVAVDGTFEETNIVDFASARRSRARVAITPQTSNGRDLKSRTDIRIYDDGVVQVGSDRWLVVRRPTRYRADRRLPAWPLMVERSGRSWSCTCALSRMLATGVCVHVRRVQLALADAEESQP